MQRTLSIQNVLNMDFVVILDKDVFHAYRSSRRTCNIVGFVERRLWSRGQYVGGLSVAYIPASFLLQLSDESSPLIGFHFGFLPSETFNLWEGNCMHCLAGLRPQRNKWRTYLDESRARARPISESVPCHPTRRLPPEMVYVFALKQIPSRGVQKWFARARSGLKKCVW